MNVVESMPLRMTYTVEQVLRAMLVCYALDSETYGRELGRDLAIATGTMFRVTTRLEEIGMITSRMEAEDGSGRPRRRYFRLTESGAMRARAELARAAGRRADLSRRGPMS